MLKPVRGRPALDHPCEFTLVGEHRVDPSRLLLQCGDGWYYELQVTDGAITPVVPDNDWLVDAVPLGPLSMRIA